MRHLNEVSDLTLIGGVGMLDGLITVTQTPEQKAVDIVAEIRKMEETSEREKRLFFFRRRVQNIRFSMEGVIDDNAFHEMDIAGLVKECCVKKMPEGNFQLKERACGWFVVYKGRKS